MESRQQDPFEDAYLSYMRALQDAWRPDEIQKRIDTANLEYLRGLADTMAPEDAPRRFEAFLQYQRALAEAQMPQEVLQRFDDAYRNYLRGLQEAWARVDVFSLDAATLAAIGQSLMAAACCASGTVPRAVSPSS